MKNNKKKEPWRIIACVISIIFIIYMWIEKDVASIYTTMPKEEAIPLIITTILVSFTKVAVIAGGILLIKWIVNKIKQIKK